VSPAGIRLAPAASAGWSHGQPTECCAAPVVLLEANERASSSSKEQVEGAIVIYRSGESLSAQAEKLNGG